MKHINCCIVFHLCWMDRSMDLFEPLSNPRSRFNTHISIAPIRIFLHKSDENISGYFKTSDPLYRMLLQKWKIKFVSLSNNRKWILLFILNCYRFWGHFYLFIPYHFLINYIVISFSWASIEVIYFKFVSISWPSFPSTTGDQISFENAKDE